MRRLVRLLSAVLAVLVIGPMHVMALPSTPGPIGGLTALAPTSFGPNLIQNSGFETLSGGLPVAWSSGAGWSADQRVVHSGRASHRRAPGADTSAQTVQLKAGTYLLSAWIKSDGLGSGSTSGARLTLDFRPGGINAWRPSEVISGDERLAAVSGRPDRGRHRPARGGMAGELQRGGRNGVVRWGQSGADPAAAGRRV